MIYFAAQVCQINISQGGVPKLPVHTAEITYQGLVNDKQNDTKHHGGPRRAISLYSLDLILALQAEGHPIFAGATGENLTVAGLDWCDVQPKARFKIGAQVLIEITSYAVPCKTIQASFKNGEFKRIAQKTHPGWSRAYAKVLEVGTIQVGDTISLHQHEK